MKEIKWARCRQPIEFVCDSCGCGGETVDWIEHVADYTKTKFRDPYEGQIGSIAVCCNCLLHKDRLIKEFFSDKNGDKF